MSTSSLADKNVVLVSHHPREMSKSPCASVYNLFVAPTAPFHLHHFLHTGDPGPAFDTEMAKVTNTERVTYLFNSMTSLASENSLKVLRHAVQTQQEIIVYWHETAWNMRFFLNKYKNFLDEARALLTIGETVHWCPTKQSQQMILFLFGCPRSRIEVVFETIPIDHIPLRDRSLPRSRETILLSAGVPDRRKGADLFIELSQRCPSFQERPIRYLWYAARPSRINFPEQSDHGNVEWQGFHSDFEQQLAAGDAFLMMSRDDPSPVVCLEALACDLPVFCFDTIGYAEVLPPNFVCRNLADMQNKLLSYLADPGAYPNGFFRQIASQFTPEKFTEKLQGTDHDDDHFFPEYEARDISEFTAGLSIKLAKARESLATTEEKFKLRSKELFDEIKLIRRTAKEAAEAEALAKITEARERQCALEAECQKLTEERKFLMTAHRVARIELKDQFRRKRPRMSGRAIVVGNSPSVLRHELGDEVDACDLVIRINNFEIAGFEHHVGTRVDKAFVSIACRPNPRLRAVDSSQIYVYLANRHADRGFAQARMAREDGCRLDLAKVNELSPTLYYYGLKILVGLEEHQWPSTGLVALQWAVDQLGAEFQILYHGFSFYEESGDLLQHYYGQETRRDAHHDFLRERLYVAKLEAEGRVQGLLSDPGSRSPGIGRAKSA